MQQNQMMFYELIWREFLCKYFFSFPKSLRILNQHMTELNGVITKILKGGVKVKQVTPWLMPECDS
jgi:hypothetical protein